MKLRRMAGGTIAASLVNEANRRGYTAVLGCSAVQASLLENLSLEELAISFLLPGMADEPQTLRLAAQIISRGAINVTTLLQLSEREGALRTLAALCTQALSISPEHEVWGAIAARCASQKPLRENLIHWTRLAEPVMRPRGPHSGEWRLVA
jgi:hypothetical protein